MSSKLGGWNCLKFKQYLEKMIRHTARSLVNITIILTVSILFLIQSCTPSFESRGEASTNQVSFDTIADIQSYYQAQIAKLELKKYIPKNTDEKYEVITVSSFGPVRAKVFYRKDTTFFAFSKSTDVAIGERDVYHHIIDRQNWNIVINMIDEFNYWTTPRYEEPIAEYLDGYIMMISAEKTADNGKTMKRIILRPNPMYDKIGALGGYLWDLEEHIYENDTLNGGNKFLKENNYDES